MIIDGKQLAQEIIAELRAERQKISFPIRLAVIWVGNDAATLSFIKQKEKVAQEIGVSTRVYRLAEDVSTKEMRKKTGEICRLRGNHGVIVQLPLPAAVRIQSVLNAVLPLKDPDMLGEKSLGVFYSGRSKILPPVVAGIKFILEKYGIDPVGKNVLVIGQGRLVGKPAALWFIKQEATVTAANDRTVNLPELISRADIIVSSAGQPNLITGGLIKEQAVIFDAAVVSENGKLVGDCDLKTVGPRAGLVTPVPGGLGPLTVAFLFKNLLTLVQEKN